MRYVSLIFLLVLTLVSGAVWAQSPNEEDVYMLENLRKMRVKQQDEEAHTVSVRQFVNQQIGQGCTPVQQVRQRIKDIEAARGDTTDEDVNITAGHGTLNITENSGTVNSDINVQIIKQGGEENECL